MPIYFTFTSSLNEYKISFLNTDSVRAMNKYGKAFTACFNIASYFTNCYHFKAEVILLENDAIINLNCYGKELYSFKVSDDNITLFKKYKDTYDTYTFLYDFDVDKITISLTDMILKSKNMMQAFRRHSISLTKVCGNKLLVLKIPIDVGKTIEENVFYELNESSSLRDLESLYFKSFYHMQKSYDKREETILEIHEICPNNTKVMEVLTIKNGEEISYKVSEESANLNLTLLKENGSEESLVTLNYKAQEINIDINTILQRLQEKLTSFYEKPFLRLLKPQD